MPQNGFHGFVGLATARALCCRVPAVAKESFVFGTVLGAVLPDIDLYPTAVAVLSHVPDPVYVYHRTASHSIFVVALFALLGLVFKAKPNRSWLWWGLALGALTHVVLDIFFWFAQIDIMWPLSRIPESGPPFRIVNVWSSDYKGLVSNIRDAFEFAAFALFLVAVRRIVERVRGAGPDLGRQKTWEALMWGYLLVALVTAFVFADKPATQQMVVNVPFLIAFLPYCWSRVWVYRREIATWAGAGVEVQDAELA